MKYDVCEVVAADGSVYVATVEDSSVELTVMVKGHAIVIRLTNAEAEELKTAITDKQD